MKKFLFISHNASRSGAPLYLLHLIQWLKKHYKIQCTILLQNGGELIQDFEVLGDTHIWAAHHTSSTINEKIAAKVGFKKLSISYQERILNKVQTFQPHIVLSNTIVSNKLAFLLKQQLKCPFIAIYHEMKFSAQFYYHDYIEKKYIDIFYKIIAVNENIKQFLINDYCLNKANVITIPPFISVEVNKKKLHNKNPGKFNILLSGFGGWQKGFDLLGTLLAIVKYKKIDDKFSFTWLGEISENSKKMLLFELDQIGAKHLITLPGRVSNVDAYYSNASLFLLLSKEDSFPLACIEAASYGLPIIAFEKSGGVVNLINNGAGVCVPFMNLNEVVNKIELFTSDKEFYAEKSNNAKNLSSKYAIDVIAPEVVNVLTRTGIKLQKV